MTVATDRLCAVDNPDISPAIHAALDVIGRAAEATNDPALMVLFNASYGAIRSAVDADLRAGVYEQMRWTPVQQAVLLLAQQVLDGLR